MIATLIIFLLLIVFFAFFIGKNLSNVCTFWLFKTYTDLPVVVLVFIAFGAGIVFSLLLLSFYKLKKSVKTSVQPVEKAHSLEKTESDKREKSKRKFRKLFKKSSDETIIADN